MLDFLALGALLALSGLDLYLNGGSPYYPVRMSDTDYDFR